MERDLFGILGIGVFVLAIVGVGLMVSSGFDERDLERDSVTEWAGTVQSARGEVLAAIGLYGVASVGMAAFAIALWPHLGGSQSGRVGLGLLFGSGILFILEGALVFAVVAEAVPFMVTNGFGFGHPFVATIDTLVALRNYVSFIASDMLAVSLLFVGFRMMHGGPFPKWVGALAVLGGVIGVVGAGTPYVEALSFMRSAGILLWMLWAGVVGAALVMGPGRSESPKLAD